jgi:hypothetical protein
LQAFVSFDVIYQSPEDESGNFEPTNVTKNLPQNSMSLDDDQQMLLDIEQNIANLEKSLNQSDNQQRKPNILKRAMSQTSTYSDRNEKQKCDRNSSDTESSKPAKSISDKKVTLRTVRNFMRLGRSRHPSRESTTSTEDEERSLLANTEQNTGPQSGQNNGENSTLVSPTNASQQGYEVMSRGNSTAQSAASSDGENEPDESVSTEKIKK